MSRSPSTGGGSRKASAHFGLTLWVRSDRQSLLIRRRFYVADCSGDPTRPVSHANDER